MTHALPYDERDHMFSRNALRHHPHLAEIYYSQHPHRKAIDQRIWEKTELGESGAKFYDPLYSPVFNAAFAYLHAMHNAIDWSTEPLEKKVSDPETIAGAIRRLARFYGAVDIGFAVVRDHHRYSHRGRREKNWGEPPADKLPNAIVIVVAMDVRLIQTAPALPAMLESSRQYVEAAKIAFMIGSYLRQTGYQAREHTDGHYEVLCVPLAVDSGLGELGRMGLLIHRTHGPCVRLAVVTTDLPLAPTVGKTEHVDHFCRICKKCAVNCPSQAIAYGDEPESRGFRHWSIDQERCFSFWKAAGTDCAFCLRVCPYSKPATWPHRLVRWYISRNPLSQRIALVGDDLVYGRRFKIPTKNPRPILPDRHGR